MNFLARSLIVFYAILSDCSTQDVYNFVNWKFHFVPGSSMGLLVAVALPLNLPNKNAYLSYNFEAIYPMPGTESSFEYPPLVERGVNRKLIYSGLENKIEENGYPGKACLVRTICESAKHPIKHLNGVLGDILHIIFTPSSTKNANISNEYKEAEKQGRIENNCTKYNKNCSISLLDLVSWIGQSM